MQLKSRVRKSREFCSKSPALSYLQDSGVVRNFSGLESGYQMLYDFRQTSKTHTNVVISPASSGTAMGSTGSVHLPKIDFWRSRGCCGCTLWQHIVGVLTGDLGWDGPTFPKPKEGLGLEGMPVRLGLAATSAPSTLLNHLLVLYSHPGFSDRCGRSRKGRGHPDHLAACMQGTIQTFHFLSKCTTFPTPSNLRYCTVSLTLQLSQCLCG